MHLQIPPKVARILDVLHAHGHEAYAVGGCIRDTILARTPDDWDITTSARPEEVKALFRRTVDTGLQHGTVTVLFDKDGFEVTTYRIDGEYQDHRHPDQIIYASQLSEDLMRRDFTINAMAYNKDEGLVDLFGGMEDLQRKVIRCVGNPRERFTEDALRILRAVRFSAQLGFSIESETKEALTELAPTLIHVSQERIQTELVKLLLSANPDYIEVTRQTGILPIILPELQELTEETLQNLRKVTPDKAMRLAVLLLPLGEKQAVAALRRLKFDNDTISRTGRLIRWHDWEIPQTMEFVRRALNKTGPEIFPHLLEFQSTARDVGILPHLYQEVLTSGQCYSLKQLTITGRDLIAQGIPPGKEIGSALAVCLEEVLKHPERNTPDYLLNFIQTYEL